ncbi:sugar ABC transporter permease [Streptomyces sp. NPDC021356]|uniref:carbohydrate ABC transporter permease n=1 Tax=Streptomyces sp. NPDC021356 TaxID=3154900 RepID=UPI0034088F4C
MTAVTRRRPRSRQAAPAVRAPRLNGRRLAPYLFVVPALLLFAVFKLYPIGWSFLLSLHKTVQGVDTFVGLDNYTRLVHDPLFWTALQNTAVILVVPHRPYDRPAPGHAPARSAPPAGTEDGTGPAAEQRVKHKAEHLTKGWA